MRVVRAAVAAIAPLTFVTLAAAQATWIVDASGGAGAQFTALPPAIAAAAPGDTLLVRAGSYTPFIVSKGIRIVGEPGVVVVPTAVSSVAIVGVPAGEQFSMRGLEVTCPGFCPVTHINISDNRGSVHLEDVRFSTRNDTGMHVARNDHVTLTRCVGNARGCLFIQQSTVSVVDCQLRGEVGVYLIGSPPAIDIHNSVVDIAGGSYRGGDGQPFGIFEIAAAPGIKASTSQVTVSGTGTVVEAGEWVGPTVRPLAALYESGIGSTIRVDPTVQLVPSGGGAPTGGNVIVETVPALIGGATASTIGLRLDAPTGTAFGLFASLPAAPVPLPLGNFWLDPASALMFSTGVVGPSGNVEASLPVTRPLRGITLVFQGVTAEGTTLRLSTPSTVVVP